MNKVICEAEYKSLRDELISRNTIINSQASTALATIISAWAAGFVFRMSIISNKIAFSDELEEMAMRYLSTAIFIIPILFFVPLAVKSGENLIQIASISTYIRVFYEYPTMKNEKSWNWESANNLLSNANVDRKNRSFLMKFFNLEYTVLAICTFFIYVYLNAIDFNKIYSNLVRTQQVYSIQFVLYLMGNIILVILSILGIYVIYRSSCMKYTLMKATEEYVDEYIKVALQRKIISKNEVLDAHDKLNPMKQLD